MASPGSVPHEAFLVSSPVQSSEPDRRRAAPHLQFIDGAWSLVRGLRFLWRTPASWLPASVPIVLCMALCVVAVALSLHYVPRLLAVFWPDLSHHTGDLIAAIVRWVAIALSALIGIAVATLVTPILSAPALERLVLLRERELGVPPRPAAGLWREFLSALTSQLLAVAVSAPLLLVLWTVTLLAPAFSVVTIPLKFIVVAWLLAWSLLDYPLSLRGVRLSARVRLFRKGAPAVFGFGVALAVVFAIPFLPLLVLPAAVCAAAEIGVLLERSA